MKRWLSGALATAILCGAAFLRAQEPVEMDPQPRDVPLVYGDGRPAERARVLVSGDQVWVAGHDLAAIFRASRFWRADTQKLTLKFEGHQVTATVGSEVALIDRESPVHMTGPALYREGRVYLPLSLFFDEEGRPLSWIPQPVVWRRDSRSLFVGGSPGRLLAVVTEATNRLDLVVDRPYEYRLISAGRGRFVLRLLGATFDPDSLRVPAASEMFPALAVVRVPGGCEVSFAAPETALGYQLLRLTRPHRVSILLGDDERAVREGRLTPFTDVAGGGGIVLRTVVLDPGHGGGDGGARTAGGLREADLALSLAREVALRLEERLGVRVLLTRDDDRSVSMDARTGTANSAPADLFLSFHFDAYGSPRVRGPRAVVAGGSSRHLPNPPAALVDLGFTAWGDAQRSQTGRAWVLADRLLGELSAALGTPSRGVEEWPLPLLLPAAMPAVFLEIDALTGTGADGRLSGDEARSRVAEAIVTAIDRYRREAP